MRYLNIFATYSQHVFQSRGRVFVWFLSSLIQPIIFLIFWQGAAGTHKVGTTGWTGAEVTTYYLLFIILSGLLVAHIEEDVSKRDIYEGELANFLTRPISYFWSKFFTEFPYRILQASFGVPLFALGAFLLKDSISLHATVSSIGFSFIIALLALLLSFIFKMIIGLMAIWTLEIGGYYQIVEILLLIFAGFIVPITFLPGVLAQIAQTLPFAYMMYYPAASLLGKLSLVDSIHVVMMQIIWLVLFTMLYKYMFRQGVKSFTGIGQ